MDGLNFCPYCDSPKHKIAIISDDLCFCKTCNRFFSLIEKKYSCFKCNSTNFEDSDFPSPDGALVLQCKKCKKMFSIKDFFSKNENVN